METPTPLLIASAKRPCLDERRKILIDTFYKEPLPFFMSEVYRQAEAWEAAHVVVLPNGDKETLNLGIEASKKIFQEDSQGPREMQDLLLSMPRPIIEALLWNTLGYRHHDEEFRKLYYKTDCTTGTYVNTFMVCNRQGRGLSRNEGKAAQQEVDRYVQGYGVVIRHDLPKDSTEEARAAATRAKEIDNAYGTRGMDYLKGERFWINKKSHASEIFASKMKEKFQKVLDPKGNTWQEQSYFEVGCGIKLSARMPAHGRGSGLENTCAPWGLLLSVLKVLKIQVELVSVPVLKTWTHTQFKKAEALITFIAGSLVTDGGCNPKQPGTSTGGPPEYTFDAERREVFIDRKILAENMKVAVQQIDLRMEQVKWHADLLAKTPGSFPTLEDKLKLAAGPLMLAVDQLLVKYRKLSEDYERHLADIREVRKGLDDVDDTLIDRLKEVIQETREELEFEQALDEWLAEDDVPEAESQSQDL